MSKITINVKKRLRTGNIYLIRCKGEPMYVGKTTHMETRWHSHLYTKDQTMRKHMAEFELNIDDYDYEILETMKVVDQHDPNLCAAEGKHFHCFTEQGYKLINGQTPNNGSNVKGSITYANNLARRRQKLPCEFCGLVGAWGNRWDHQATDKCKYFRMYQFTQNLTL